MATKATSAPSKTTTPNKPETTIATNENEESAKKIIALIQKETKETRKQIYDLFKKGGKEIEFIKSARKNPILVLLLASDTHFLEKYLTEALTNLRTIFDADEYPKKSFFEFCDLPALVFGIIYQMSDLVNQTYAQTGHRISVGWNEFSGKRTISVNYFVDEFGISDDGSRKRAVVSVQISSLEIYCENLESCLGLFTPANTAELRSLVSPAGGIRRDDTTGGGSGVDPEKLLPVKSIYENENFFKSGELGNFFVKRNRYRNIEYIRRLALNNTEIAVSNLTSRERALKINHSITEGRGHRCAISITSLFTKFLISTKTLL